MGCWSGENSKCGVLDRRRDRFAGRGPASGRPFTIQTASRLRILLRRLNCDVTDLGILRDKRGEVSAALIDAARDHDAIVTSGGVSTGEEDHVRGAMNDAGSLAFWRPAIKPGRPVAMGVVKGTPLVGTSRQSCRRVRDLCLRRAAAACGFVRRDARAGACARGHRRFRLPQEKRPARICSRVAGAELLGRNARAQISRRWCRRAHLADRDG